ncbi:MAG: sulfotransferase [Deltaproteobacteria bacterium]|nr:sulfotransferase [Deltaproteobacteria bacterium]
MSGSNYGLLDKLLHRLALQSGSVAEMSYDLDQKLSKADPGEVARGKHVFISGLARAGTTVLMRRFHASGSYRSLTYRDMPFVLAPNLWRRLSSFSRKELQAAERAHGDNIIVDADSPESLDEVFWRIFSGREYIKRDCLIAHEPSEEISGKFLGYVAAILSADPQGSKQYLSKNNNNILRLGTIRAVFPNSLLLIPFRNPLNHAFSLLSQHQRFSKMQQDDGFVLSYMKWLGHHEFGLDHRRFHFGMNELKPYSPDGMDYWLSVWCETYEWLEKSRPEQALFVCYEDLCANPEVWHRLARLAEIPAEIPAGDELKSGNKPVDLPASPDIIERCNSVYERLRGS